MNVSFEDDIKPAVNYNDHLYHIIRANSFAFCLICLEDISNSSEDVGKHLGSENHQESIKRLFQACNPNLPIDNGERFVDQVSRSLFDISMLLGKETCYICKRDGSWFCIMCEKNITEIDNSDSVVKEEMIDHVLSETHVNKTRAVYSMYELDSDQEANESKRHQLKKSSCFQRESHSFVKKENVDRGEQVSNTGTISDDWKDSKNESIRCIIHEIKAETIEEPHCNNGSVFKLERGTSKHDLKPNLQDFGNSFNEKEFCEEYRCTCLLCKRKIKLRRNSVTVSIDNHFKVKHLNTHYQLNDESLQSLMDSVIFHKDPGHIQIMSNAVLINENVNKLCRKDPITKKHMKYTFFRSKICCFCAVCMVDVPPSYKAEEIFENLLKHFNSSEHQQYENEKLDINRAFNIYENDATSNVSKSNLISEIKREVIEEPCLNKDCLKETSERNFISNLQVFGESFDEYEIRKNYVCTCLFCKKEIKGIKGCFVVALDHHFRSNHLNLYTNGTTLKHFLDSVVFNKPPVNYITPQSVSVSNEIIRKLIKGNRKIKKKSKYIFSCNSTSCFCIVCMFDMPLSDKPEELLNTLSSHFLSPDHKLCVEEQMKIKQAFNIDRSYIAVKKLARRRRKFVKEEGKKTAELRTIKQLKKQLALQKKKERDLTRKLTAAKFEKKEERT